MNTKTLTTTEVAVRFGIPPNVVLKLLLPAILKREARLVSFVYLP